jgi:hypothetical protein
MKYFILFFVFTVSFSFAQKDSVHFYYLTKDGFKHPCSISFKEAKMFNNADLFEYLDVIGLDGLHIRFYPDSISGYFFKGKYFKSFTVDFNDKRITFLAQEKVSGKVNLYAYKGKKLDDQFIYIFKKYNETEYTFIQQSIEQQPPSSFINTTPPPSPSQPVEFSITKFYDEQPYLEYFRNYLMDCSIVNSKFKSNWYTYDLIETMFKDYNKCK